MDCKYQASIIGDGATIKEALERINALKGVPLTLFVTDLQGVMVGSLTDGDIRRGLLAGAGLEDNVEGVMHRAFRALCLGLDQPELLDEARALGIAVLPVLDADGRIVNVVDLRVTRCLLPLDAVLMAGGRGERLRPLTDTTPKPLLPVGGKPIIDYNIEALRACGVKNIYATVNYLRQQLIDHFAAKGDPHPVQCVEEDRPLGTFGSIGLVKGLEHEDVLVMNSDLLTDLDFEKMYRHHRRTGATLTMACTTYTVSVPYAIVQTEGDSVRAFQEKPTYNYFANAGVYIVKRKALASVTGRERVDATDFIDSLLEQGQKVAYFPIEGTWIDIGSPDDYRLANRKTEQ